MAMVDVLTDSTARAPSLLPGWTRAMLVAHVTSAGNAALRCADAAQHGESVAMYPGGEEQRDQEIESGRDQPMADLLSAIAEVCAACDTAFASLSGDAWTVPMTSRRGPIPMSAVAAQRWLDVEAHRVDLDLGYSTQHWPTALVDNALPVAVQLLPALRKRPDADRDVVGVWEFRRTDGDDGWALHAEADHAWLADPIGAGCQISAPGRALLALIIGRQVADPMTVEGDVSLAAQLKRAFPGP